MYEPGYRRHGLGDPLGECGNLPLEVDQEGVRPPSSDGFDGAVRDMGLMEDHGATRAQGVGADLMGMESQALEVNFSAGFTQAEEDVGSCNRSWCSPWGYIVCANGSRQEHLGGSLRGDDAVVIMKLDIAEAELGGAAV